MKWEELKEDEEVKEFTAKFVKYAPIIATILILIGGFFFVIIWLINIA